jgi:16S rRNA G527 N7-methylase RsmG
MLARQPWPALETLVDLEQRAETVARLKRFVELLLQWNRSVSNLISQNDEERIVAAHLAPSVEPAAWIRSHDLHAWADFGSGGGFPAIPLALCGIGRSWDLVESRRTKTLFLRRAVEQLSLGGTSVLAARLEDLVLEAARGTAGSAVAPGAASGGAVGAGMASVGVPGADAAASAARGTPAHARFLRAPFDGFTSRATMALGATLRLARPIVRTGGAAFLWKGSRLDEEIAEAREDLAGWREVERRALANGQTTVIKLLRTGE